MTRFKITGDTRREIDRARAILSQSYIIRQEKSPQTSENQRFRLYLYGIPKEDNSPENEMKAVKTGR